MKTTLCFILTLLTFVTHAFVPNSFAQDTSPEYIVRVIYFYPNDIEPQEDSINTLGTMIKDVQEFFAEWNSTMRHTHHNLLLHIRHKWLYLEYNTFLSVLQDYIQTEYIDDICYLYSIRIKSIFSYKSVFMMMILYVFLFGRQRDFWWVTQATDKKRAWVKASLTTRNSVIWTIETHLYPYEYKHHYQDKKTHQRSIMNG